MWIGCLQERCCFPNVLWSPCSISCVVTLHPKFPECSRPPALAGVSQTDRRTTGNKGMLRRSRDIHHHDRLHSTRMVTLPLQSVSAESGENSSQNSPGQRSQESIAFLLLKVAFSVDSSRL
ncbi:hypothetical protein EV363DRAFT_1263185 [Boletus edulis]|nr:hypothetical protein EV363DRAFT_1263185 [Boletus edulis]